MKIIHFLREYQKSVWVVSPDKTLHRHLFDLVSTGGDSTSTNMRDYFDNFANVLRQYAKLFRQFKRKVR